MHTGRGILTELILNHGQRMARISCAAELSPAPGQYLLSSHGSDSPLSVPLFYTDSSPQGFIASHPIPEPWRPGMELFLRGPLGHGFVLPASARRVALIAYDDHPARLRGLIQPALKQGAAVVLVSETSADNLPEEIEVQPLAALNDVIDWADYAAIDCGRENLPRLMERLGSLNRLSVSREAQALIRTQMPCGALAECGVCAVTIHRGWKMACKDGPVFDLNELG